MKNLFPIIIILILFSIVIPFTLAKGNFPTPSIDPEMTAPTITISSPINNSVYLTDSVDVLFSVTAPSSDIATDSAIINVYLIKSWVLDKTPDFVYFHPENSPFVTSKEFNFTFSELPEGEHSLEIGTSGIVIVQEGEIGFQHEDFNESKVYFTISLNTQTQDPNSLNPNQPTYAYVEFLALCIALMIVIVPAVLFRYVLKNKSNTTKSINFQKRLVHEKWNH